MAVRISQPIRLDGLLDDPAWELAQPLRDFYQQWPDEYRPAARPTEVRFLYDDTTLYIGAMNYDDEPDTLIVNDLKRDFGAAQTEALGFAIDTFRDRQNAYGFQINPGGAMRDVSEGSIASSTLNGAKKSSRNTASAATLPAR